jgi:hypothetical protein
LGGTDRGKLCADTAKNLPPGGAMSSATGAMTRLIVTPRPLGDYRNMFLLTEEELTAGPILDCPAGASPFGAQVRARGGTVVSVDPAYALPRWELVERIRSDLDRLGPWLNANTEHVNWPYLGSPDALVRFFELAVDYFLADYDTGDQRYVAAALPSLPFPDKHFRLSLCSHLLFTYPDFLPFEWHVAAMLELIRVTSGEVRVFPLVDSVSTPYAHLDRLRATLLERGVHTEIRRAACAYNKGGDEMIVARRAG